MVLKFIYFGGLSEWYEQLKSIYFCWHRFAGNDFRAFLTGKQRIKSKFKEKIFHHFQLLMNLLCNKIIHLRHTSKIFRWVLLIIARIPIRSQYLPPYSHIYYIFAHIILKSCPHHLATIN